MTARLDDTIPPASMHRVSQWWWDGRWQWALSLLGALVLLYSLVRTALALWLYMRPSSLPVYRHAESGSWALVTGASDGIGRGFAEELLARGFHVLLHGRNPAKLQRVRDELAAAHPQRAVEIAVADASKGDDGYRTVVERVEQLPGKLTVLVNNVGGIPTHPQYVAHADTSHESIDALLNVNARFPLHLIKALTPRLTSNAPSLILNCGSTGALLGSPYIATYIGTKALIHEFTTSLKMELAAEGADGVEVLGLMIGNVESAGNRFKMAMTMTSRACAAACLDRVGCGLALSYAHWTHAAQVLFGRLLPTRVINDILTAEMRKRVEASKKGL